MTGVRKSTVFFLSLGLALVAAAFLAVHASSAKQAGVERLRQMSGVVERYGLTDLCLFTDARYTRHLSMADLNTPFQDYPMSFEHFPSGSLFTPPPHLIRHGID
jgi:hypothetical protein